MTDPRLVPDQSKPTAREVAGIDKEAFEAAALACHVAICSHKSARMVTAKVIQSLRETGWLTSDEFNDRTED